MTALASKSQIRMSLLRYALFTVPAVLLLGTLFGRLAGAGAGNAWYDALIKPAIMPPGALFGIAWTILYILLGIALAMILHAKGARGRPLAIGMFVAQLALNYAWTPVFFGMHQVRTALMLLILMLALSIATTILFARIRRTAALLMLPYLVWLSFASLLNYQIIQLNPDAENLVAQPGSANIEL